MPCASIAALCASGMIFQLLEVRRPRRCALAHYRSAGARELPTSSVRSVMTMLPVTGS